MPDPEVRIGSLRWPVIVGRRKQNFDPSGSGVSIFEAWEAVETVHAEVMPIGSLTFYVTGAMEQVDTPVTHRITTRWLGYLDNTYAIIRNTTLPDARVRGELFRVRRVKELNGRKRFASLDCELEKTAIGAYGPGSPFVFTGGIPAEFSDSSPACSSVGSP